MSSSQATPAPGERLTSTDLLQLLYYMRLQRAVEDRGIKLYYQGRIPGAYFTGWGHEAIAVGATYALGPEDLIAPMHRDLAAYIMRGIPVRRIFAQFLDREGGLTRAGTETSIWAIPGSGSFHLSATWRRPCPSLLEWRWRARSGGNPESC
jgi:TPP-dependent pyruvate/acetoin dehydrogenase alpha subunit